jgi:hypothetical protein
MKNNHLADSARRAFLSMAIAGGAGAAFATRASGATPGPGEPDCGRLLITDLLTLSIQRLDQVLSDVLAKLFLSVAIALDECKDKFEILYGLVTKLEAELRASCKGEPPSQVTELKDLTEAGRASLKLINSSTAYSTQEAARILKVTKTLSQQVCAKVEELLPPGESKLSKEATDILREILREVMSQGFRNFHETVGKHSSYTKDAEKVIGYKDRARSHLLLAQDYMALAENPSAEVYIKQQEVLFPDPKETSGAKAIPLKVIDRTFLRRNAVINLRAAIEDLKGLVTFGLMLNKSLSNLSAVEVEALPDSFLSQPAITIDQTATERGAGSSPDKPLTGLDSFLLSLSGLVHLVCSSAPNVCDANKRPLTTGLRRDENETGYMSAAHGMKTPAAMPDLASGVVDALARYCGNTCRRNVDSCVANIRFVRTWFFGRRTGLWWLTWADMRVGNIVCVRGGHLDKLVARLVTLI